MLNNRLVLCIQINLLVDMHVVSVWLTNSLLVILRRRLTVIIRILAIVLWIAMLMLGGPPLTLILQLNGLRKRSLLLILLPWLLLSLINGGGAATTAVLCGLALIVHLFGLAYQLFVSLRRLLTPVVIIARFGQALILKFREVLRKNNGLQQLAVRLTLVFVHGGGVLHILLLLCFYDRRLEQFIRIRPLLRVHVQHLFDDGPELNRIGLGYPLYLACANSLKQALHAGRLERWLQGDHFV